MPRQKKNKNEILTRDESILIKKDEEKFSEIIREYRKISEEKDEIPLQKMLEELRKSFNNAKTQFFSHDLSSLRNDPKQLVFFLANITHYYTAFCFFPDPEIKERFKYWGIPLPQLKWMIPLEEILEEFNNISKNENFIFIKELAFDNIIFHIEDKIFHQIFRWGCLIAKKKSEIDLKKFGLLFRRLNEGQGRFKRINNIGEIIVQDQIQDLSGQVGGMKQTQALLLDKAQGKTEKSHLKNILTSNIQIMEITEEEYLCCVFDLFRIICKDKRLLSEKEFELEWQRRVQRMAAGAENKSLPRNRVVKSFYDGDYSFYRCCVLKKLIFKR